MPRMNKQQLSHLQHRLNDRLDQKLDEHPNTARLRDLDTAKKQLLGAEGLRTGIKAAPAAALRELLLQITATLEKRAYFGLTELTLSFRQQPAAAPLLARIASLENNIRSLQTELDSYAEALRKERERVFDLAVFADSPAEVLTAIEGFLKD